MSDVETVEPGSHNEETTKHNDSAAPGGFGLILKRLQVRPGQAAGREQESAAGRLVIAAVQKGSPAAQRALQEGDELVSICGHASYQQSLHWLSRLMFTPASVQMSWQRLLSCPALSSAATEQTARAITGYVRGAVTENEMVGASSGKCLSVYPSFSVLDCDSGSGTSGKRGHGRPQELWPQGLSVDEYRLLRREMPKPGEVEGETRSNAHGEYVYGFSTTLSQHPAFQDFVDGICFQDLWLEEENARHILGVEDCDFVPHAHASNNADAWHNKPTKDFSSVPPSRLAGWLLVKEEHNRANQAKTDAKHTTKYTIGRFWRDVIGSVRREPEAARWRTRWVVVSAFHLSFYREPNTKPLHRHVIDVRTQVNLFRQNGRSAVADDSRQLKVYTSDNIYYLRSLKDSGIARDAEVKEWHGNLTHAIQRRMHQEQPYQDQRGRIFARRTDNQVRNIFI